MKQRISALDLQLLAKELRENLEGYRLNNIYNIVDSNRQFLLKFNKPDSKFSVIVDCGLRIHLTDYDRPIPTGPSGFVIKLRKHLKSKRLTALRQVHDDRILVLQFADGLCYLVLEFFSAGNVILLDENKKILALQRIVREYENKVGEQYTMFDDSIFSNPERANVRDPITYNEETVKQWFQEVQNKYEMDFPIPNNVELSSKRKNERKKQAKVLTIHRLLLSREPHLSSDLLSKNLRIKGLSPSAPFFEFIGQESKIVSLLNSTEKEYQNLLSDSKRSGYIILKRNVNFEPERDEKELEFVYETFHPFEPFIEVQNAHDARIIKIEGGYNKVLDTFFSTIESSKYLLRIQQQEQQANRKLEAARLDNQKKIQSLIDAQSLNEERGHSIIANADLVEKTRSAIQGYIDQQMDWSTIEKLIQVEQRSGNKIAQLIQLPLSLEENKITIRLPDFTEEEDESENSGESSSEISSEEENSDQVDDSDISDFETEETIKDKPENFKKSKVQKEKGLKVNINLSLSAYANASYYFNIKKSNADKQKKVEKNVEKAFKNIQDKVQRQLKQKLKENHDVLRKIRTPYFFEKHYWFISSEGFLVLMGKSHLDTDMIYKKYVEDDDIYLFNTFGTQVWIKNPDKTEVPPNTLMQASIFCMSGSEAWSKKISSSPWWCYAKNISKFEPTDNSVLPPGRFFLKNEHDKHDMSPAQLLMGFGFLWKVKTEENGNEDIEGDLDEGVEEMGHGDYDYAQDQDRPEIPGTNKPSEKSERKKQEDQEKGNEEPEKVIEKKEIDGKTNTNTEIGQGDYNYDQDRDRPEIPGTNKPSQNSERKKQEDQEKGGEESRKVVKKKEVDGKSNINTDGNSLVQNMRKNVRGKKGKLKKIQRKYGDQDEDERQLRLQMLGTLKGVEKQQLKEQEELQRQEKKDLRKARLKKEQEVQALEFTKNEKARVNYKKFHNELKAGLKPNDEILDVIPVCAPWPALLRYKYKVKIQPGNAKKTKSMQEILHYFTTRSTDPEMLDKEADWPSEHEAIKQLREQDLILTLSMDRLKVIIPGSGNNKTSSKGGKNNKGKRK